MAYYVRPPDPHTFIEMEREELAREAVRKNTAEVAKQTARMNAIQENRELEQRVVRDRQRKLVEVEEREARRLADRVEREERIEARARRILRERGHDDAEELVL